MKSYSGFACVCVCAVTVLFSIAAPSAPPPKEALKKPDSKPAATPDVAIPLSVFVLPATPSEGRDPFFPKSTRPYASQQPQQPQKGVKPPVVEFPLTLNGITPASKLAMVNGRTFSEGEEGDVVVNGVRKRIRCLKVKDESAIIELLPEGERRELKMRLGA